MFFEESGQVKYILSFSVFRKMKIINLTDISSPYSQTIWSQSALKGSLRKTLPMFTMMKLKVRVGAEGKEKNT